MVAYREIVKTKEDIIHIANMLKEIKEGAEVIIVPFEKDDDKELKKSQITSMAKTWNNIEDEAWNEL